MPELAVYSVEYEARPTKWHGEAQPLLDQGKSILDALLAEPALRQAPTAFVCHSLGGLVTKAAIQFAFQERRSKPDAGKLFSRMAQVVFLGTPHLGADLANIARRFGRFFQPTAVALELQRSNDSILVALNDWYRNLAANEAHHIDHLVFRETESVGRILGTIAGRLGESTGDMTREC